MFKRNWIMGHYKITDYTVTDWLKQAASLMAVILLGRMLVESTAEGNYAYAIGHALGLAGWIVIYFRMMKNIRLRNQQD